MKIDFLKHTKRNMIAALGNSGVKLLFPFLNRTLFLWLLGPEYLGLNGLFGSILGMLMLAELGFGMAVICSMYKPVAEDNREQICAYLNFYRTVYRCVGAAIFGIGLALLPFLRNLVHGDVPADINLHILYLIHLVNTSASYFLFAYRGSVLGAYHRNDVVNNIRTAVSVAQYIAVFLILLLTRNYYHYVLATVVFTVAQNILLVRASRRLFPDIEPRGHLAPELRRSVISDVKSIFLHRLGAVVANSADNIVIASTLGLVAVAAYGNYYYVITSVAGLINAIHSSTQGGFGNKIYTETKENTFELFMKTDRLTLIIIAWCAAMMAALYGPFIEIWTKGEPTLTRHALTPALMIVYFFVNQSRRPLQTFKAAASLWRQDRWKPIVSSIFNLAMSFGAVLLLPEAYKLDGVIGATILSFLVIELPWESHIVFKEFFGRERAGVYWRSHAVFAAFTLALCGVAYLSVFAIPVTGISGLAIKVSVSAVTAGAITFIAFRNEMMNMLRKIL